ncbi:MAG: pantothenate kinase [Pseudomonas sp.]|uniref:pantothenate kinase n=1 Tax=Stutzerimonas frequens TaxID=2968969 RepID=UPI0018316AA6|nr:pantothenate kinase [Stutzerimonas frequens]MBA4728081.1 pantothenate kinase [Pseudomonas sp.]MBK3918376.1 pantothenate kinase [Stutzerimonas frequens]
MILEVDCGNSLIKWRVLDSCSGVVAAQGASSCAAGLLGELGSLVHLRILRARLVSVRSDQETMEICTRISDALSVHVQSAAPAKELGGVINGYLEYERLGMDRWLAMVGAFQLKRDAMLVLDLGTAVTADLVDAQGVHLGGFICPGISLLRSQLHAHTQRIRYSMDEAPAASCTLEPGRTTVEAVERGCLSMLHSFVSTQIRQAGDRFGAAFSVYATGGDAGLIKDIGQVQRIPDLVFRGLAIACP